MQGIPGESRKAKTDLSKAERMDWAFMVASTGAWAGILSGLNFPQSPKEETVQTFSSAYSDVE